MPIQTDLPDWPIETARMPGTESATLAENGSNIVLDLHGDPHRAGLVVFSDGNHHMALQETLAEYLKAHPSCEDVFYATTPPRIIIDALTSGSIRIGNLTLAVRPDVFISPENILASLFADDLVGQPRPFARSAGLAILLKRGNPLGISGIHDLLDARVRLALSNPVTESASYSVYEGALLAAARQVGADVELTRERLRSEAVVKSRIIHHREIPALLAADQADVSVVYQHLALRYCRIFPQHFEHVVVDLTIFDDPSAYISQYHAAPVGVPGMHARQLLAYLNTDTVREIYRSHALDAA